MKRLLYLYFCDVLLLINSDSGIIDVDDILSENFMPRSLLMLENPINAFPNVTSNLNFEKKAMTGTFDEAITTMDFHRSKINEYLCRNFLAEQILQEMSIPRIRRRLGIAKSTKGSAMKESMINDEGSKKYEDWLTKSTTLEDIYRHYETDVQKRSDERREDKEDDDEEEYDIHDPSVKQVHDTYGVYTSGIDNHHNTYDYGQDVPYNGFGGLSSFHGDHNGFSGVYDGIHGGYENGLGHFNNLAFQPYSGYHDDHSSKYHKSRGKNKELTDLLEIASTALAFLSFGMFIIHVIMCISSVSSNVTTVVTMMPMSMNPSGPETAGGGMTGEGMTGDGGTTMTGGGSMTMTGTGGGMNGGGTMPGTNEGNGMTDTGTGAGMPETNEGGDMTDTGTGGGMAETNEGGDMTDTGAGGGMPSTSEGDGMTSTGDADSMTGAGGGMTGTGGGAMTGTGGGAMTGTGGGAMTGTGEGGMTGNGGGAMTSTGNGDSMTAMGANGMTGTGGGMTSTAGGGTDDGSDMTGDGNGMPDTEDNEAVPDMNDGDGMTDTGMGDGMNDGTNDGTDMTDSMTSTGTGGGVDMTATGRGVPGKGMNKRDVPRSGGGSMPETGSGSGLTAKDGVVRMTAETVEDATVQDNLNFRYKRNAKATANANHALNELARRILVSIEAAFVANNDRGVCLRKTLCDNNKYSRTLDTKSKIWIPIWSLGMSWLSNKLTRGVAPATSILDSLKASILGLGNANCEIIYQDCNLNEERNKRRRRK